MKYSQIFHRREHSVSAKWLFWIDHKKIMHIPFVLEGHIFCGHILRM